MIQTNPGTCPLPGLWAHELIVVMSPYCLCSDVLSPRSGLLGGADSKRNMLACQLVRFLLPSAEKIVSNLRSNLSTSLRRAEEPAVVAPR